MSVTKDYANIPNDSVEHFFPQHLLRSGTLADAGVILGGLSYLTKGYYISRPAHRSYHVIFCTISGTGTFYFEDGSKMVCRQNNIVFTHADGKGHIIRKDTDGDPWEVFWLHIDKNSSWFIPPALEDTQLQQGSEIGKIKDYIQSMFLEETHQNTDIQVQELLMKLVLAVVNRMMNRTESPQALRHKKQLSELWMQVTGSLWKPWTLADLCSTIGMSKSNLTRLCMELHHTSPVAQVRTIKMEHAKYLLSNTDIPINRIAAIVGYKVPATFSAAFSTFYGFSPREARRNRFKLQPVHRRQLDDREEHASFINIGKGTLHLSVSFFLSEWNEFYTPIIISDERIWDIAGTKVHDLFTREGIGTKTFTYPRETSPTVDTEHIEELRQVLADNDLVGIVVGHGVIHDIAKRASFLCGKPYMLISTIMSTDEYSNLGILYQDEAGEPTHAACSAPHIAILDTELIRTVVGNIEQQR